MDVGLRIDVDTFRGTRLGVPALCALLASHGIRASFFFSVGPDNMGRHLWRLLQPAFLLKMLRTNAPGLYGWDILFRGTFWPGTNIGDRLRSVIRDTATAGHEVGLHAWDHHAWQSRVARMTRAEVERALARGVTALTEILGRSPTCSAAPAWRCTNAVLTAKLAFPFQYNSDCRGDSVFQPVIDRQPLSQPQIPTTLPTYDEVIGRNGITDANYNAFLLDQLRPGRLNVLTIHAEAEGLRCREQFAGFVKEALARKVRFLALGDLPELRIGNFPQASVVVGTVAGREGWIACQSSKTGGAPLAERRISA